MNRFNEFLMRRNFKKIIAAYLIAAVVIGIAAAAGVGYVFRDKIALAVKYERASEAAESGGAAERREIDALVASPDITDVLVLDENNRITYSAKKSKLALTPTFELKRAENGGKFLSSENNPDMAFRFVKNDEFMLKSVFADDFGHIHEEYDEDSFYVDGFQNKEVYMISLLGKNRGGEKVYVISNPGTVPYGMLSLKAAASVMMLLFMIYWIIVALLVYKSALKAKLSAPVWGIIALCSNLAGVLVYLMYRHISGVCAFCGAVQSRANVFCSNCGKKIGVTCTLCGHVLRPRDNFCPRCGNKRE